MIKKEIMLSMVLYVKLFQGIFISAKRTDKYISWKMKYQIVLYELKKVVEDGLVAIHQYNGKVIVVLQYDLLHKIRV